jgi:hypothetical protein
MELKNSPSDLKAEKVFFLFRSKPKMGSLEQQQSEGNCSARFMGEPRELQHQQTQCPGPSRP